MRKATMAVVILDDADVLRTPGVSTEMYLLRFKYHSGLEANSWIAVAITSLASSGAG
jgi:hypothetical protein